MNRYRKYFSNKLVIPLRMQVFFIVLILLFLFKVKFYLIFVGILRRKLGEYLYMAEAYIMFKTIAIMVHKDVIPSRVAKKLELKE